MVVCLMCMKSLEQGLENEIKFNCFNVVAEPNVVTPFFSSDELSGSSLVIRVVVYTVLEEDIFGPVWNAGSLLDGAPDSAGKL